jgi:hypothetical protein
MGYFASVSRDGAERSSNLAVVVFRLLDKVTHKSRSWESLSILIAMARGE